MFAFFLIFPAITFLYCFLTKIKSKGFGWLFVFTILFYCLNIKLTEYGNWSGDITRYIAYVSDYKHTSWIRIFNEKDYFFGITAKLLSNISNSQSFYILFYGLIFSIFNLLSIKIVIENFVETKPLFLKYLLLFSLILVYPCVNINALRFAIATVFYVWCLLEITINDKKWFCLIILLSPMIHYSYWIFAFIPILWLLLKNRLVIVQILFLSSFFLINSGTAYFINDNSVYFGESVSENVGGYASEGNLEKMNERYSQAATYGNLNRRISRLSLDIRNYGVASIVFLISLLGFKDLKNKSKIKFLFSIMLLCFAGANIASSASNGDRFYHTACFVSVFILFYIFYYNSSQKEKEGETNDILKRHLLLLIILFLLVCLQGVIYFITGRGGYNLTNFLFGNFFFLL